MRNILLALFFFTLLLPGCGAGVRNVPYIRPLPKVSEVPFTGRADPILRLEAVARYGENTISHYGSAFVTKYKGKTIIVTALHVVSGGEVFKFYTEDRKYVEVTYSRVIGLPPLDSAVFFVKSISADIKPLQAAKMYLGDDCKTIGFSDNKEKEVNVGKVLSKATSTTADVNCGMSGGPVITRGNVVGIISSKVIRSHDETKSLVASLFDVFDVLDRERTK